MKFAKYLEDTRVPEWAPMYFNYKKAKKTIKKLLLYKAEELEKGVDPIVLQQHIEDEYRTYLEGERKRVNDFYNDKVAKCSGVLEGLRAKALNHEGIEVAKFNKGKNKEENGKGKDIGMAPNPAFNGGDRGGSPPTLTAQMGKGGIKGWANTIATAPVQAVSGAAAGLKANRVLFGAGAGAPNVNNYSKTRKEFRDLYNGMVLLKNFGILNNQAFHKAVKKYNKNLQTNSSYLQLLESDPFFHHIDVEHTMHTLEGDFASILYGGNKSKALRKLRPDKDRVVIYPYWISGLLMGVCMPILCIIIQEVWRIDDDLINVVYLPLYRVLFMPIFMLWGAALDMYVWREYKVNYKFIMDLDSRKKFHWEEVAMVAGRSSVWVVVCMYLTIETVKGDLIDAIPPYVFVIIAFLAVSLQFGNPFNFNMRYGRWTLAQHTWRIFTAPFHNVVFMDFFIADQFTSMIKALGGVSAVLCILVSAPDRSYDNLYPGCYNLDYVLAPILGFLPLWFRFAQCLRRYFQSGMKLKTQLVNSGKYFTSIVAVALAGLAKVCHGGTTCKWIFYGILVVANTAATSYSYAWDIKMDWGLLQKGKGYPLRTKLVYPKWWYYVAAVVNLCCRLSWTVALTVETSTTWPHKEFAVSTLVWIEMSRRVMWNLFRVENEQVNNLENYRAFKDVVVPQQRPDDSDDEMSVTPRMSTEVPPVLAMNNSAASAGMEVEMQKL